MELQIEEAYLAEIHFIDHREEAGNIILRENVHSLLDL